MPTRRIGSALENALRESRETSMNRQRLLAAASFVSLLVPSAGEAAEGAPARQPPSHAARWMMRRGGAPVVSPDGRLVVFTITEPSYDERKELADLWIAPSDGSAKPRRLTPRQAGGRGGRVRAG